MCEQTTDQLLDKLKPILVGGWMLCVQRFQNGDKWTVSAGSMCCGYHDTAVEAMKTAIETLTPDA